MGRRNPMTKRIIVSIMAAVISHACLDERVQEARRDEVGEFFDSYPCFGRACALGSYCLDGECVEGCSYTGNCIPEVIRCEFGNLYRDTVLQCRDNVCEYGSELYQDCDHGCQQIGNDTRADECIGRGEPNSPMPDDEEPQPLVDLCPELGQERCNRGNREVCTNGPAGYDWAIVEVCEFGCFNKSVDVPTICLECRFDSDCPEIEEAYCYDCEPNGFKNACIVNAGPQECRDGSCFVYNWGTCMFGSCIDAADGEPAHCPPPKPEPDVCEDMDCSPFEGIDCVDGGLLYFAQTGKCRNGTCERIWDVLVEECPDFHCDDNESFGVCRSPVDWDNDGWAPDEGDCDDGDDLVYPGDGALVNCVPCSEPDHECPHNGTIMCRDGVLHGVGYTGVCLHEYGDVPYVCEPQHEVIRECEFGCADERSCADPPQ